MFQNAIQNFTISLLHLQKALESNAQNINEQYASTQKMYMNMRNEGQMLSIVDCYDLMQSYKKYLDYAMCNCKMNRIISNNCAQTYFKLVSDLKRIIRIMQLDTQLCYKLRADEYNLINAEAINSLKNLITKSDMTDVDKMYLGRMIFNLKREVKKLERN